MVRVRASAREVRDLVLWRADRALLTVEDLAAAAGLHPEVVERFVGYGLVEPAEQVGSQALFPASTTDRLRRIVRLRRDLGVNLPGVAVILDMRERIVALQRELERLRRRLGSDL